MNLPISATENLDPRYAVPDSLAALSRANSLPVLRPKLPSSQEILPYLQSIDERQWYSNWGPLVTRLQDALRRHLRMVSGGIVTTSNATAGLTAALLALDVPPGSYCLMPSWTFAATPHATRGAGLIPWFHDVAPGTWALDPGDVIRSVKKIDGRVGAVVVVAPFGAPIDTAAWESVQDQTGIPVVIDAAAAFDTVRASRLPVVVSLHATKILAAGEGGFVITTDQRLRDRVVACCNFGFAGSRSAITTALNAKMSEYHAAVALASLANWRRTVTQHMRITQWYREQLAGLQEVVLQPGYGSGWACSTTSLVLPRRSVEAVAVGLQKLGIETRPWWGRGCHVQPAFAECPRFALPVTEDLGARVLGLPHFVGMSEVDVRTVVQALGVCLTAAPNNLPAAGALDTPRG